MTERKTSWQRSINGIDYVPDVWIVCWNVILASGIKIIFWAIQWRLDSLVLSPQLPPLGVVVLSSRCVIFLSVFACITCKWLAFYRLLVLSQRERKQEIDLGDNSPLVRKSKAVLDSSFHTVDSGFKVLDFSFQWKLDSGFQSLVGFFRIPNPRISDSTSNNFPDFAGNPDSLTRCEIMN